jgi:hypothetical protein
MGVLANATRAAVMASTMSGSSLNSAMYLAHKPEPFIMPPPWAFNAGKS